VKSYEPTFGLLWMALGMLFFLAVARGIGF
jgi:hypothetical protein